ncbi:MAG TPA: decarboxylating 6-phosphogluconate dehydrogenase [Deltaproteobacteria bacterium]|nr:decarboxylating 6-phosphogluconate dehydrogenase [Deltaproteobacteria bacterium]
MHIGMIGLGRMGMNMARRLVGGGHRVTATTRSRRKVREAVGYGVEGVHTPSELVAALPSPRVVWIMVPAGDPVDAVIAGIRDDLGEGDIIIDGGNTFYRDDLRRAGELAARGVRYVDVGTSGGIWGLEVGYCLMVGGDEGDFRFLEPLFRTLAPEGGYMHCGPTGAGHFVKMVHNAVEYGMMEAYGEGFELLKRSRYGGGLDMAAVARLWNNGSVVRSWLLELLERAFEADKDLEAVEPYVEDSGEGRWSVQEAVDLSVSLPAISAALFRRFRSRDPDSFAEKVLAALRKEFGGHAVKQRQ